MKTLQEIAAINQLEVVNTTSGSNGYPENIQPALIGFTTPEQMISVMNEFGLECVELMKKDGWDLYKREGLSYPSYYENSSEDFGDDYLEFYDKDEEYQRLQDLIEEIDDQEEIEALEANYKSLCEKIDEAKPNQVVITRNGEYYETIERYSMKFYEDSKLRTKGLIAIKD